MRSEGCAPKVSHGKWLKRFPEMTVCGEGELIKTFLRLGQIADGEEVACSDDRSEPAEGCDPIAADQTRYARRSLAQPP